MKTYSSLHFADGKRTIDFVLVYTSIHLSEQSLSKLECFLDNVRKSGVYVEIDPFTIEATTYFVKLHLPKDVAIHYAQLFSIDLACTGNQPLKLIKTPFKFMATPLTIPNPDDPIYERTQNALSDELPEDVTSAEKIMIMYRILSRIKYGKEIHVYGIRKLIKEKVFTDAFALHEGPYEWTESGELTDRQLLSKFWGSWRCWYKEQPLNLIERYYGTELAFYFAWLGVYVKMLIPAGVLSIICVIYGVVTVITRGNIKSEEICNSKLLMCPRCVHCNFEKLSNSCVHSYITYLFDNAATIVFAVVISFWSTIFMEYWGRTQSVLELQWNVKSLENDMSMRPEYVEATMQKERSATSGVNTLHTSEKLKSPVVKYTVTIAAIALMLLIVLLGIFGVMTYRVPVSLILRTNFQQPIVQENAQLIAVAIGSSISVSFVVSFRLIYWKVAIWLTDLENHRTQGQYDNSFIFKSYAMEFTNTYAVVFYIAFFKGKFFTHPGDSALWTNLGGIAADTCNPTSCIIDLGVQLTFIMLIRIIFNNMWQLVSPLLKGLLHRIIHKVKYKYVSHMPLYERDYLMAAPVRYYLVREYMDMVIQYGFVVFFVAGFPLAPFLALLNNLLELRLDAYKITRYYRRPIPNKVSGIGAWMAILQAVTYIGVVTNALVIAFTSNFVPKQIYKYQVDTHLRGFTNTTISAFDTADLVSSAPPKTPICYYPGRRYPPDHENKYELTTDYWFVLAMRFLVVVIFEHVVMIANGMVAYAIPDVPTQVTERLALEERKNKDLMISALGEKYDDRRRNSSILGALNNIINNI